MRPDCDICLKEYYKGRRSITPLTAKVQIRFIKHDGELDEPINVCYRHIEWVANYFYLSGF